MRTLRRALPAVSAPLLLALAAPAPAPWQSEVAETSEADVLDRIADEALRAGRSWQMLEELCTLAPHRLAGSAGAERAVEWARERMESLGLENVRLEPCTVPRWERGEREELVVLAPEELARRALPILALGGSVATPEGGLEGELLAVRSFGELEELGDAVEGKIVLFARPMDDAPFDTFSAYGEAVDQRVHGPSRAAALGAAAVLVRSMTTRRDDVPHTGALRYADDAPRIPAAAIATRAADELVRLLEEEEETVRVRLSLSCRTLEPVESHNVIGEIPGRELPGEIVLLGAHLDAWDVGQGAHDDGAGCVQVMEALRILRELDLPPRRTLRCVLFMNEENGRAGAFAYRDAHRDELARHVLALESDRGGFTPRGFTAQASDEARAILARLAARLGRTGATEVVAGGGGADIAPLAEEGVPLVGYWPDPQRYFDVHHAATDVLETVHPRELALGAAAIAGLVWQVAERAEPLPRTPRAARDE